MYDEGLFDDREMKTETISIRLTKSQKDRLVLLARTKRVSASKLVVALIGAENERQVKDGYIDIFIDDGIPF